MIFGCKDIGYAPRFKEKTVRKSRMNDFSSQCSGAAAISVSVIRAPRRAVAVFINCIPEDRGTIGGSQLDNGGIVTLCAVSRLGPERGVRHSPISISIFMIGDTIYPAISSFLIASEELPDTVEIAVAIHVLKIYDAFILVALRIRGSHSQAGQQVRQSGIVRAHAIREIIGPE